MSLSIKEEIIEQLDKLPITMQKRVLNFAQALVMSMPKFDSTAFRERIAIWNLHL